MALLFTCPDNAARSPLAEAIARHLDPSVEVFSAGREPSHVRPQVRRVLEEVGVDAHGLRSKGPADVPLEDVSAVITLASSGNPTLPSRFQALSWPLPDPSAAPDDELLEAFRATRDELLRRLAKHMGKPARW